SGKRTRRSAESSASSPHLSRSIMPTKASHFQTYGSVGSGIRYGRIRGFKKSSPALNQRPCTTKDRLEFRQPANLALRVTFTVIYPAAPAQSRVHTKGHYTL